MGCGLSTPGRVTPGDIEAICKRHFDVERVVGHGGFGKVNAVVKNRGHDRGKWYAMKSLSKSVILERNHVSMVLKERNLLARLHCPQLVNMHYAFQDQFNLYIVNDLCLGGDLHYQLMHSPDKCFTEIQARFYVASIVVCLEYMHSVGVLHRDIKPENLLLDSHGQLKVTDLGISMEVKDGICESTSGTRPYMAPEVFMTGHKHSTASDFYSLGITAYQFLVGSRPYKPETSNMRAIVRMAMYVPPERYTDMRQIRRILIAAQERKSTSPEFQYSRKLSRFSAEARDFVQSCLICNPRYRLGSLGVIEMLEHPWFANMDWDAIRNQTWPAPFTPDTSHANCAISPDELQQLVLNEEEQELGPDIPLEDQSKFASYNYRVLVQDGVSERGERLSLFSSRSSMSAGMHCSQPDNNLTLTGGAATEISNVSTVGGYSMPAEPQRVRTRQTSESRDRLSGSQGNIQQFGLDAEDALPPEGPEHVSTGVQDRAAGSGVYSVGGLGLSGLRGSPQHRSSEPQLMPVVHETPEKAEVWGGASHCSGSTSHGSASRQGSLIFSPPRDKQAVVPAADSHATVIGSPFTPTNPPIFVVETPGSQPFSRSPSSLSRVHAGVDVTQMLLSTPATRPSQTSADESGTGTGGATRLARSGIGASSQVATPLFVDGEGDVRSLPPGSLEPDDLIVLSHQPPGTS